MSWYKKADTADDVKKMFEGMGGAFRAGADEKVTEYAKKVLALKQSNPAWSWQQAFDKLIADEGFQNMPQMRARIAAKVKELGEVGQSAEKPLPPKMMEYVQRIQGGEYRNEVFQGLPLSWQQQILKYLQEHP